VFTGYVKNVDAPRDWVPENHRQFDTTSRRMFRLSQRSGRWRWEEMPSLRVGRIYCGAAAAGTTIVVVGGQTSVGRTLYAVDHFGVDINAVEAFDTGAPQKGWFDLPPVPWMGREAPAAAAIGTDVYVFGGSYWNFSHLPKNESGTAAIYGRKRQCGDAYV